MELLAITGAFIVGYALTRNREPSRPRLLSGQQRPHTPEREDRDPELQLQHPDIPLTIAEQELLDDLRD